MELFKEILQVRARVDTVRSDRRRVGLVPTMGALHGGHLSLIRACRKESDFVVVSVFVNPSQFGPNEDYSQYPRRLDEDLSLCRQEGVDLVFAPATETIYPESFDVQVRVEKLSDVMEGHHRQGHFHGVATVVLKLLNIVQPHAAYFGQKDAQQVAVIKRMVADLDVPVEIKVCPIVRDPDGLALSSRNAYLSESDREKAVKLSESLHVAAELVRSGEREAKRVRQTMHMVLESAPDIQVDYAELVDPLTFQPVRTFESEVLAVVAARVGSTRLIDNRVIAVSDDRRAKLRD